MNTKSLGLLLALSSIVGSASADDVPKPFTFARYQGMMDRSPFAVATAAAPVVAAPNFAKDLFIANAARSPAGDMVTLASSTDKNFKKYLTTNSPVDGFSISSVEWSDKVGATKVTIAKDGQFATLTFNQAVLSQSIAANQPGPPLPQAPAIQPPTSQPGVLGQPAVPMIGAPPSIPFPKAMPVPVLPQQALPTPPPRVRGVIPRNPNANTPEGKTQAAEL